MLHSAIRGQSIYTVYASGVRVVGIFRVSWLSWNMCSLWLVPSASSAMWRMIESVISAVMNVFLDEPEGTVADDLSMR